MQPQHVDNALRLKKKTLTWIFLGVAIDEVRSIWLVYFRTGLYPKLYTLEAWIPGQYIFVRVDVITSRSTLQ